MATSGHFYWPPVGRSDWPMTHEPNADNVDRCRRILLGELTLEAARAEIEAKYRQEPAPAD